MTGAYNRVYQFKIVLDDTKPKVWRKIQVPETYSLWDLHVAIQDAMGWLGCHLYEFDVVNVRTNQQVYVGLSEEGLPGNEAEMTAYFNEKSKAAKYTYDFGDDWRHTIKLEKIVQKETNTSYPKCISGARACPPEDCGGTWRYNQFLEMLSNSDRESYEAMYDWFPTEYNPDHFDVNEIHFSDPIQRRNERSLVEPL